MFERYTDRARRSLVLANEVARETEGPQLEVIHLLAGIAKEGEGLGAQVLQGLGISYEDVLGEIPLGKGYTEMGAPPFSLRTKKVLEYGLREALQLGHNYIGQEHLLLAIVREGESDAAKWLMDSGINLPDIRRVVIQLISGGLSRPVKDRLSKEFPDIFPGGEKASIEMPRRILFRSESRDHETGHGWQYMDENPWHPFLEPEIVQEVKLRIEALRRLLEPPGAELETTRSDGWKFTFKLESQ